MTPIGDRLWQRVDKTGECWIWIGATRRGYGYLRTGPRGSGTVQAHRLAYETLVGAIPVGLVLDHLCRVRRCVRPDHLEPVTLETNILRGTGWAARNAAKTKCPRGHLYDRITADGYRSCWTCCRQANWRRSIHRSDDAQTMMS